MDGSRIHFVNRFFYPDISATSQILSGIAFGLAANGFDVHITTSRQLYEDPAANLPAEEIIDGVTIHRIPSTRFGRSSTFGRAFDYASFYASTVWHLLSRLRRGDVLITKTDPPILSVLGTAIGRIRGTKCINWLQDLFPEVASSADFGGTGGKLALASTLWLRNWSLRRADHNVVIGDRMALYLRSRRICAENIHIIPNWSDPDVVHPIKTSPLRSEWDLAGKFVVGYSGNLGRAHEIKTLVDAIREIHEHRDDPIAQRIMFVFVGNGALRRSLETKIQEAGLQNVRFFPYQPVERLAETLAVPDVHLVSLRPELEGFVVPSKIYGIMAASRPGIFIGATDGEVARLLRRYACGTTVQAEDGLTLADAILKLAHDPEECNRMGIRARAAFEENFTKAISVNAWDTLLRNLMAPAAILVKTGPLSYTASRRRFHTHGRRLPLKLRPGRRLKQSPGRQASGRPPKR
ncbi:MAG: glycosyltransferase family 4 protein [Hyphomicrobiaceae bacterium]